MYHDIQMAQMLDHTHVNIKMCTCLRDVSIVILSVISDKSWFHPLHYTPYIEPPQLVEYNTNKEQHRRNNTARIKHRKVKMARFPTTYTTYRRKLVLGKNRRQCSSLPSSSTCYSRSNTCVVGTRTCEH